VRKRYVQVDGQLVEVGADYCQPIHANAAHNIIPDIQPYQSMKDGTMITSRSKHRAHLRQHDLVEIGNEHDKLKPWKVEAKVDWKEALREQFGRRGML